MNVGDVKTGKPGVCENLSCELRAITWLLVEQRPQEVAERITVRDARLVGNSQVLLSDLLCEAMRDQVTERNDTEHQLVCDNANRPEISLLVVHLAPDYFRCHIGDCAALSTGLLSVSEHSRGAKVDDFDVAVRIDGYIFEFDIPMHDVSVVQLLHSEEDLANYELHLFFVRKSFRAAFWWLLGLESFA